MAERITIARPYAKAVFKLAHSQKRLPQWSEALGVAASVVADPRVAALLGNPDVSAEQLVGLVTDVGGARLDEQAAISLPRSPPTGAWAICPKSPRATSSCGPTPSARSRSR